MQNKKVLCFNINVADMRALDQAARAEHIAVCEVAQADFSQTVGALLGVFDKKKEVSLAPFREPMIIMSGLAPDTMERFLDALKQNKVQISYKAVVTPTNLFWKCDELIKELVRERAAFEKAKKETRK